MTNHETPTVRGHQVVLSASMLGLERTVVHRGPYTYEDARTALGEDFALTPDQFATIADNRRKAGRLAVRIGNASFDLSQDSEAIRRVLSHLNR